MIRLIWISVFRETGPRQTTRKAARQLVSTPIETNDGISVRAPPLFAGCGFSNVRKRLFLTKGVNVPLGKMAATCRSDYLTSQGQTRRSRDWRGGLPPSVSRKKDGDLSTTSTRKRSSASNNMLDWDRDSCPLSSTRLCRSPMWPRHVPQSPAATPSGGAHLFYGRNA
jgi:hypothetical protein